MKKIAKVICLLVITAIATACDGRETSPTVLSLDLSDAIAVFNGNNSTDNDDPELAKQYINNEGAYMGDFGIYKVNENGVTKRIHVKTKRSDDDQYFYKKNLMPEFREISDEYFFGRFGDYDGRSNYFINKRTGEALKVDGRYSFHHYSYWFDSTNPMRDFSRDNNGHIYGRVYDYSLSSYVLARFTITDKKVKAETLGEVIRPDIDNLRFNDYAVDKDGNVIYGEKDGNIQWKLVTLDDKAIPIETKSAVWTGYDGGIYAYSHGNIEKLTYNKEENKVDTEVVRAYPELADLDLVNAKLLYVDDSKQIYAYGTGKNLDFVLYQIYGENMAEKPYSYTVDDLSYPAANSSWVMQTYGYTHSGVDCDEDSIYVTTYDGESYIINRIDTKNNMEHTQIRCNVENNDGERILSNKKMLVFYWGHNDINLVPESYSVVMSVGIFDLKTGTRSKQDKFVTGNSSRSSVINIKSYK